MSESVDVLILGSGFGGSLLSMLLAKSGLQVAVIERAAHPRFAIGESSTPLADTTLARLADDYDLPQLRPLAKYGSWKREYSDVVCGQKRGFSYFGHQSGEPFNESQQLLVAASRDSEHSDTHWLRSDVDHLLFRLAGQLGVRQFEGAAYELAGGEGDSCWCVEGTCCEEHFRVTAPFVVDGTGRSGEVLRHLNIADQTETLATKSAAVFGHFRNVRSVAEVFSDEAISTGNHPFPCDAAAVHHVLNDGWMWQLRFDDDTVSAGFAVDRHRNGITDPPDEEWERRINRFPFLKRQFAAANLVRPVGGLVVSERLQRLATAGAGQNWAALPNTIGFIDPLHSTGIAHTLFGVQRLAKILLTPGSVQSQRGQLEVYSAKIIDELRLIDELVEGCYAALPSFELWSDWCMLYFAAVTSMEQSLREPCGSFLGAADENLRRMLIEARQKLQAAINADASTIARRRFRDWLRTAIEPLNQVGLLNDDCHGMYANTAAL